MSDTEKPGYDWSALTGQAVQRLRAKKVVPVDPAIVRQAQRSWDGVPDPQREGKLLHVLSYKFPSEEMAAEFARQIKNAGEHTQPQTSVSAVIDPAGTGDRTVVNWRAGARRGRSTS